MQVRHVYRRAGALASPLASVPSTATQAACEPGALPRPLALVLSGGGVQALRSRAAAAMLRGGLHAAMCPPRERQAGGASASQASSRDCRSVRDGLELALDDAA